MPFPYIFTFYSFKGGVGRSMALMNTAYRLAGWGRHVLIIDMDLEAPGVSSFLARNHELTPPIGDHPRDVLAFLHEARMALDGEGTIEQKAARLPPLDPYLRSVLPEKLTPLQPKIGQLGRLDVLGQNVEASYPERLAALNLKDLPTDRLAALSALLHFYFKAQRFPHRPLGLPDFEPPVSTPYDYVLVDSRTGLTETGGLCVGPLADRLVVLTGLNDQNVEGTRHFFNEVGITPGPREPWDDADPVNKVDPPPTLGPKPTILVASPIPVGELTFKRQRLAQLETQLGIRPLSLSYHPQLAFQETVFVRDYPDEYLAREYDSLANDLMATVCDTPSALADLSWFMFHGEDPAGAVRAALRLVPVSPDLGLAHLASLSNAIDFQNTMDRIPFVDRFSLHAHLAHLKDQTVAPSALNNWGNALSVQAKLKQGQDADRYFAFAGAVFAEAVLLRPDTADVLSDWGVALSAQAKTKQGEAADRLFALAGETFSEAVRVKPDHAPAFNNWGEALSAQAKTMQGEDADRLFDLAMEKYAEAVQLTPDDPEAFHNWAGTLVEQAKTKHGEEARQLLNKARGMAHRAEEISPGSGAYNLACLSALVGDPADAVQWLRLALQHGKTNLHQIESDPDFNPVRDHPLFKDFLESLPRVPQS